MERIRELRTEKGLTQVRLAVAADMNPATLNRIEQGKANPNLKTLERLADALGVEVADLFPKKAQSPLWRTEGESEQQREPENVWQALIENAGLRYTLIADPNSRAAWGTTEKALKDLVAENTVLRATVAELREELAKVRETA